MSELTKRIHKLFAVVDRVAFIGHDLPSSTMRNDVLILLLNAVSELERHDPSSEILAKLKIEMEDIAP